MAETSWEDRYRYRYRYIDIQIYRYIDIQIYRYRYIDIYISHSGEKTTPLSKKYIDMMSSTV